MDVNYFGNAIISQHFSTFHEVISTDFRLIGLGDLKNNKKRFDTVLDVSYIKI